MKIFMISILTLLFISETAIAEDPPPINPKHIRGMDKEIILSANCGIALGPMSSLWTPSISFRGLGSGKNYISHSSMSVIEDYVNEMELDGGLFAIELQFWKLENPLGTINKYNPYLKIMQSNNGTPFIRFVGTPSYLQDPQLCEDDPYNYMGYPAEDMEGWRDLVYNVLKYIVIENDTLIDPHLFAGDSTPQPTLGMGDNIYFSFWNGIWGYDNFQFKGTEEELFEQWNYTVQAVYQLEEDYPGIDIQIGGMGWNTRWDLNHFMPNRLVDNWLTYSMDNGLTIDFIDLAYRSNLPFGLSMPPRPIRDYVGNTRRYLSKNGYDTDLPIINTQWQAINVVKGENSARGYSLRGVELQSHIMSAMVPTRLFDMESVGLDLQYREAIQDFNAGDYPLFMDIMEPRGFNGGIGLYTIGLESEEWFGLRKPEFNAWKMISMLKDTRIETHSQAIVGHDKSTTLNLIGTKDSKTGDVAVLVWFYLDPNLLGAEPIYSDLLANFPSADVHLEVNGLEPGMEYIIHKYTISEMVGNSFTQRFEILESLQSHQTLTEINHSDLFNLQTEETANRTGATIVESFTMEPYSLYLFVYEKDEITNSGDESNNPTSPKAPSGSLVAYQNVPNPFNPSTAISFTVREEEDTNSPIYEETGKRPVCLRIYDIRGRMIREILNEELQPGNYTITWNGRDSNNRRAASGVYMYCLSTEGYRVSKKMTLIK
jgi:hypothetical protein